MVHSSKISQKQRDEWYMTINAVSGYSYSDKKHPLLDNDQLVSENGVSRY